MQAILRSLRLLALGATAIAVALAIIAVGAGAASAGTVAEIEFAPGTDHASIDGAVIRGESDSYLLEARGGQALSAELVSVEDNAVFTISAPDGSALCVEATSSRITLPQNGYYMITVAPSRGNATYTLSVRII